MRLGLISDIHGNQVALEAVIADATQQGVDAWWVLGDLVAIGPDPIATLDMLRDLPNVRFVRGNTDRYVVTGDRPPPYRDEVERDPTLLPLFEAIESSFTWTRNQLDASDLEWLAALPAAQEGALADGTRLLGVHASPQSDDDAGITPTRSDHELAIAIEGTEADVICSGHTHRPTDRRIGTTRVINLGSVSNPITSDLRATYVIIDSDRVGHHIAHRRVAYDRGAVLERLKRSDHPEAEYIASFQRGDQVRHPADQPGTPAFAE